MPPIYNTPPFRILVIAAIALMAAFTSQYLFGLYPCILCIYQRIPYAVIIVLCILAALFPKQFSTKPLLFICGVAFISDAAIAFFHMGVEYTWWEGTSKCTGAMANSVQALRAALSQAPIAHCNDPQFTFILTMAGWNMLYALSAAAYCIRGLYATTR